MRLRRWMLAPAAALVAVLVAGILASVSLGLPLRATVASPGTPGESTPAAGAAAGSAFLSGWVDHGRVVRRDQGGDTVSEGQAYGMLVAVGTGDRAAFDAIWSWTRKNLQRGDGLLAWRWADGAVVDDQPASDADLDTARALVLAGARFSDPALTAQGDRLGGVILDRLTVATSVGRILLPGLWAAAVQPYPYNPSYASPAAFAVLAASSGDPRWAQLEAGSAAVTTTLLGQSALPPDWGQVHADGTVDATPGAAGAGPSVRYGFDAARMALRYAESCTASDVALSARLASTLGRSTTLVAELDLGGTAIGSARTPLSYGARAAALAADDKDRQARSDLARSASLADSIPTYYGVAWNALAPLLLETTGLGGCPPLRGAGS